MNVNRGNNTIHGGNGVDTIEVKANGNNIYGEGGDDVVNLNSTSGNTLNFSFGDGVDTVDCDNIDNVLNFSNTKFEDMTICVDPMNSANLKISYSDDDTVILKDWFNKNVDERIDTIVDSQGESYSLKDDALPYMVFLTTGDDTYTLSQANKTLIASTGDDTIYVRGYDNIIIGGIGNDIFSVSWNTSNHKFVFSAGDGNDKIIYESRGIESNILKFTDTKFEDMMFLYEQNNLIIYYGNNDSITFENWYNYPMYNSMHKLEDKTGNVYDFSKNITLYGTNTEDILTLYDNTVFYGYDGDDKIIANGSNNTIYAGDGDDTATIFGLNNAIYGGTGDDTCTIGMNTSNNKFVFSAGDGNDTINYSNYNGGMATNILKFTDALFENIKFVKTENDLVILHTDYDSVTVKNWVSTINHMRINKITDATDTEYSMSSSAKYITGGSTELNDDSFIANVADNTKFYDFYTTDNDTLTFSDTNANGLHVAANFKSDGTLDGNGLRVLSDDNYTAWMTDTTSVTGGVQVVSELGSVENIKSADGFTVTASELSQLQSDVSAWLTAHTDYADVASAIANKETDTEVAELVAIFDNFNNTAWGS